MAATYVGTMPEDSMIPTKALIKDLTIDGAIPAQLDVPYLGLVSPIASPVTGTYQAYAAGSFHGGNEGRLAIRNVTCRNIGASGFNETTGFGFSQQNGGILDVDGMTFENCVTSPGAGTAWWLGAQLNTAVTSTIFVPQYPRPAQQQARVTIRNVHQRNCSGMASTTAAVVNINPYQGLVDYFDIGNVTSDGSNAGGLLVYANACYPDIPTYILEEGCIHDCYSAANDWYAIGVGVAPQAGPAATYLNNGITLARNRLYYQNSNSGQTYYGAIGLLFASAAAPFVGEIRLYDNETSFGADTDFPISVAVGGAVPSSGQQPILIAHRNRFDSGPTSGAPNIKLGYGGGASGSEPDVVSSSNQEYFARIESSDNGLLGQAIYRSSSSPQLTIPYWEGDINLAQLFPEQ